MLQSSENSTVSFPWVVSLTKCFVDFGVSSFDDKLLKLQTLTAVCPTSKGWLLIRCYFFRSVCGLLATSQPSPSNRSQGALRNVPRSPNESRIIVLILLALILLHAISPSRQSRSCGKNIFSVPAKS